MLDERGGRVHSYAVVLKEVLVELALYFGQLWSCWGMEMEASSVQKNTSANIALIALANASLVRPHHAGTPITGTPT
jgi:hypothetical protein